MLTYTITGLDVIGDIDPVDLAIRFYADTPYPTYGLLSHDYPGFSRSPGRRRNIAIPTAVRVFGSRTTRPSGGGRTTRDSSNLSS
jgi:hypothetical protein